MIIDKGETHNYQHNTELPSSLTRIMETKKTFHVPTNTYIGVPDYLVLMSRTVTLEACSTKSL